MAQYVTIQSSLSAGELSPSLYGRVDLNKWHEGCSTYRNFLVDYRGGALSRPGTHYVGTCKQSTGSTPGNLSAFGFSLAPPRDIPFQFSINQGYVLEFGDQYMRIKTQGAYVTNNSNRIYNILNGNQLQFFTGHTYIAGDWIYITNDPAAPTQQLPVLNGLMWKVVSVIDSQNLTITDLFGTTPNSVTGTGFSYRIYTVVSPYAAIDLPYLKWTQSADTITLTCVNTATGTEYPPYDLKRLGATNWVFTQNTFGTNILAPIGVTATAQNSTTVSTWYSYVVTAVSDSTNSESVASSPVYIQNNDIAIYAGSNTISWSESLGANSYNIYKATPSYSQQVPVGVLYGFVGSSLGNTFVDTNIVPDYTITPPVHDNPFARGQILTVNITGQGTNYTQATVNYSVGTGTGSGFIGSPIVSGGKVLGFLIQNAGQGYIQGDSITLTDSGTGAGATATLTVGPQTGTYPSTVTYYQQRRAYASTLNNPDTYFLSQPGNFLNMDSAIPISDSDAVIGTPWAQQVNGIQYMIPMPGGLVILTGKGAWQLNGGASSALTPANQTATPQAYNGCHSNVNPIVINYDILYVQAKGSIIRDLSYNFFVNIYTGSDLTVLSNHLFNYHQIVQWCWQEEPFKVVWCLREDGILLSLTYLKEQEIYAWARHDTNGQVVSVSCVTEQLPTGTSTNLPQLVDSVYLIVRRYVQGQWMFYSERLDDRNWSVVDDAFCVDSGLTLPVSFRNSTLAPAAATGTSIVFTADPGIFTAADVNAVIRVGGGIAVVKTYQNPFVVDCDITSTILATIPNDTTNTPSPAAPYTWSISQPISTVSGLNHLNGKTVAVLADGAVVANQVVTNNSITLPVAASAIAIGLPYTCQLQTLNLDHPEQGNTVQSKRKVIDKVAIKCTQTRGLQIGADQPDASTQVEYSLYPWTNMIELKERTNSTLAGNAVPLFTGDHIQNITSGWNMKGQVAVQQIYPLPATVLSIVSYWTVGGDK